MKFGDTLRERSIPQWAYCEWDWLLLGIECSLAAFAKDNVDYDDLKGAIKQILP